MIKQITSFMKKIWDIANATNHSMSAQLASYASGTASSHLTIRHACFW